MRRLENDSEQRLEFALTRVVIGQLAHEIFTAAGDRSNFNPSDVAPTLSRARSSGGCYARFLPTRLELLIIKTRQGEKLDVAESFSRSMMTDQFAGLQAKKPLTQSCRNMPAHITTRAKDQRPVLSGKLRRVPGYGWIGT